MARKCQKCGGFVGEEDLYCIHCGALLERAKEESLQDGMGGGNIRQAKEGNSEETAEPLGFKEYLLIGVLLLLPVVNIILAIIWATGRTGNPNRRNLARAWLVFAAAGTVIGGIFLAGLLRAIQLDELAYPEEYDYYEDYWDDYEYEYDYDYEYDYEYDYDYDYDYDFEPGHHWEHGREI